MNRIVLGAVSALLLAAAGLFWWQGKASIEAAAPPPPPIKAERPDDLLEIPDEDGEGMRGDDLPQVDEATREERRFNRIDRNRDNLVSRAEALQPRVAAFRKLDKDGNNMLIFEEWAVDSSNSCRKADAEGTRNLTRTEFATTKPKAPVKPGCKC